MAVLPGTTGGQNSAYRSGCFRNLSLAIGRWQNPFTAEIAEIAEIAEWTENL